jgi:hypothetical protein
VDGKYWFPNYQRSDDTVHLKNGDFPVRLVIKWSDFKPCQPRERLSPATPRQFRQYLPLLARRILPRSRRMRPSQARLQSRRTPQSRQTPQSPPQF